jgi:ABC-type sugar transport system ATPase subunit
MGIIYISHRLDEVIDCCDTYTVLCDGRHINSGYVKDIDKPQLIKMIIGRELKQVYLPINQNFGEVLLEVQGLTGQNTFRDINIKVRRGEVVGIAGLVGAYKTELLHAIFGNQKVTRGKIFIKGKEVAIRSPQQAVKLGLGFIPDERRTLGLNMLFDIKDNTVLPSMSRFKNGNYFKTIKRSQKQHMKSTKE